MNTFSINPYTCFFLIKKLILSETKFFIIILNGFLSKRIEYFDQRLAVSTKLIKSWASIILTSFQLYIFESFASHLRCKLQPWETIVDMRRTMIIAVMNDYWHLWVGLRLFYVAWACPFFITTYFQCCDGGHGGPR